MVSTHASGARAAIAGILTMVASVACGATAHGQPPATTTPGTSGGVAIPPDAAPWAPVPFQAYLPTPLPLPTAKPAPQCSLNDLTAPAVSTAGATGNDALFFAFTNRTSHPCLTGGYPRVVLSQPGERTLVATPGGFWDEHTPVSDLDPGETAQFDVGFSYACETEPAPPLYRHVAVTLPGGGSFTKVFGVAQPSNSQLWLGVFVQCGVTVSAFSAFAPQPMYPVDPLLRLTATITAPSSVSVGSVFKYVITLTNPTSESIPLDPCRGYYQRVDLMKSPFFSFQLNCGAAHPIAAEGSESFVMEMTAATLSPGLHTIDWNLDTDGTPGPEASARFTVVS